VQSSYTNLPFGDGEACSGPTDTHHFTGKERDSESGNDYFGARYYASAMGRWLSPDKPFADQHPANPQSWNLYEYAGNDPLGKFDSNGEKVNDAELKQAQALIANYAGQHPGGTFYIDFEGIKGTGGGQNPRAFDGAENNHAAANSIMVQNEHWGRGFLQASIGEADTNESDTGIAIYQAARNAGLNVGANLHSNGVNALGKLANFILNSTDPKYRQNLTTVRMVEPNTMNPSTIMSIINSSDVTRADICCYDPALRVSPGGSMFPGWWRNWDKSLDVNDSGDFSHDLSTNMKDTGGPIQTSK
jgi:RHS repeat-associated protein